MKTRKPILPRLLSLAMVLLLVFAAALPVFAEPTGTKVDPDKQANLTITIKNNDGLPGMDKEQFTAYQLFTGTPNKETENTPGGNVTENEWDAHNWNNYNLANIEWGANISNGADLMAGLKAANKNDWPRFFDASGESYIQKYIEDGNSFSSAADLANFLVGLSNSFLQEFSRFVMEGNKEGGKSDGGFIIGDGTKSSVSYDADDPADDESSITVPDTGYYLIVENGKHDKDDAVSEYILAVMGDQTINLKASVPTVDKNIVAGKDAEGADVLLKGDSVGITDTVNYRITGTLPKNYGDFDKYEYFFHDTLSKGLTYDADTSNLTVTVTLKTAEDTTVTYKIDPAELTGYEVTVTPVTAEYVATSEGKYSETDIGKTLIDIKFTDLKQLKGTLTSGGGTSELIPFDTAKSYDQGNVLFTVDYSVTVNENAVIGSTGNPNDVYLEYSNDPNHSTRGTTEEKEVVVYSFALDLTKTGSDEAHASALEGAGFLLSKKGADDKTYYAQFEDVYKDPEAEPKEVIGRRLKGWIEQSKETGAGLDDVKGKIDNYIAKKKAFDNASKEDQGKADSTVSKALNAAIEALKPYLLESGENGKIPVTSGLDAGNYTLTEAITPAGYNTMADIEFTIEATTQTNAEGADPKPELTKLSAKLTPDTKGAGRKDATFNNESVDLSNGQIPGTLQNRKAPFLPFTGGIGTMIFYVLGIALISGAVTYLVIASKKRRKAEENA